MVYRRVDCPHCGNEVKAMKIREEQKCKWCKRLFVARFFQKRKGKKWFCEVEPVDFPVNNYGSFEGRF